ncbi:MAG: CHAP domain-containing protein [Aeriscardovia sp.]|nr:CHAP domain-containing protein [Aeriscardovia sp.]
MSDSQTTLVAYTKPRVYIQTMSMGIINVSDDIINISVSHQTDAVSTCNLTLLNYSNAISGKYNGLLHVGDKIHVDYIMNGTVFPQFTGRLFTVPLLNLNTENYSITAQDCIGDMQWKWWCPYSQEAQEKYFTYNFTNIVQAANTLGEADSGMGNVLLDFLENVVGMPSSMVKIAAFPDLNNVMHNILKDTVCDHDSNLENEYEKIFTELFGTIGDWGNSSNSSASTTPQVKLSKTGQIVATIRTLVNQNANSKNAPTSIMISGGGSQPAAWNTIYGVEHTGKYGLTQQQCAQNKHNSPAYKLSENIQDTIMTTIAGNLLKQYGDVSKAIVGYFIPGWDGDWWGDGHLSSMNYNGSTSMGHIITHTLHELWDDVDNRLTNSFILINGTAIKSSKDLEKYVVTEGVNANGTGETTGSSNNSSGSSSSSSSSSNNSNSSSSSSSSSTTIKPASGAQKIWQTFYNTYTPNSGKYATGGNSTQLAGEQCWALWETYAQYLYHWTGTYHGVGKQPDSQLPGNPSPTQGNWGYWTEIRNGETALAKKVQSKMLVIAPSETAQTGDVVFFKYTNTTKAGAGQYAGYGHVAIVLKDNGSTITVLNQWAGQPLTTTTFEKNGSSSAVAGYLRPKLFGNTAPTLNGTNSGNSTGTTNSATTEAEEAYDDTFKLFKYLDFNNTNDIALSMNLSTTDDMYDNVPTLDYVKSVCHASMRTFMSLPDGSFGAFVPDYYGFFSTTTGVNNIITLPLSQVKTYTTNVDKSSYKTHVFLLTDELTDGATMGVASTSSLNTLTQLQNSSGIITLPKQGALLCKLMDFSAAGVTNTVQGISTLMNRWGVSVLKKQDMNIVSHVMTTIEAVYEMLTAWANVFKTSMSIIFRPDILPGVRLTVEGTGTTYYVSGCSHSWDVNGGGTTSLTLSSPVTTSTHEIGIN